LPNIDHFERRVVSKQWNRCSFQRVPLFEPSYRIFSYYIRRIPAHLHRVIEHFKYVRMAAFRNSYSMNVLELYLNNLTLLQHLHVGLMPMANIDFNLTKVLQNPNLKSLSWAEHFPLIDHGSEYNEHFIKIFSQKLKTLELWFQYIEMNNQGFKAFSYLMSILQNIRVLKLVRITSDKTILEEVVKCCPKLECLQISEIDKKTFKRLGDFKSKYLNNLKKLVMRCHQIDFDYHQFVPYHKDLIRDYYIRMNRNRFDDTIEFNPNCNLYHSYDKSLMFTAICLDPSTCHKLINNDTIYLLFNFIYDETEIYGIIGGKNNIRNILSQYQTIRHIRTREEFITNELLTEMIRRASANPNLDYSLSGFNSEKSFKILNNLTVYLKYKICFEKTIQAPFNN
jgi:hypothetical protein